VKGGQKVWLITGSSRGFGAELVTAVLESGDAVLATARHPEDIKQPMDEHRERVRTAPLDVTDPGAAEAAVALAQADLGGLDVVVNNAGYANSASIEEMDPEDFRAQIEANLFGVVNVTRAALPVLRAQRSGTLSSSLLSEAVSAAPPGWVPIRLRSSRWKVSPRCSRTK
jgi:NAD(P)-dependent dehydrogenase (short-subunit alcohol dehydrogenase family)